MTITVRRATLSDLEQLVEFAVWEAEEAEGIELSADVVRRGIRPALEDESVARYWVATGDDRIIGNISVIKEWSNWKAGYYWWIQSIYLRPEYRGRGLTRTLLQAVKDSAVEDGALEIRLYVHRQNANAIRAYLRAGFVNTDYQIMALGIERSSTPSGMKQ